MPAVDRTAQGTAQDTAQDTAHDTGQAQSSAGNPLAIPAFRAFWVNGLSFMLVQNALRFVYGWVILDGLNRSPSWQGGVVFLLGVPMLFLLPPAGVWADRVDPKRLLIVTQLVFLVVLVVTAIGVGDGSGTVGLMVVSALAAGVVTAIGSPVRSSLIPALLPPSLLVRGIALNAIAITLSMVFGAVSAQLFGNLFGFDGAFWWLAGLLVVGVGAALVMESPGVLNQRDSTSIRESIAEGVAFVRNDRGILTLFWLLGISGFIMMPMMMVGVQAHVKEELGRSAGDAAPFFAMMGFGIAISSLVILRRSELPNRATLFMRAMICGTTTMTLLGFTRAYWQVLVLGLLLGMCAGVFMNMNQALIQGNTPSALMGRVMALYLLVQAGLLPYGALIAGVLLDALGTGRAMSIVGALGLSLVLITYVRANSIRQIN